MANFDPLNCAEEIQDYLAANSGLGLTVGTNFTLGNLLNVQDLEQLATSKIDLTMYEEPGTLVETARKTRQERTFRFVYKGDYGQEAVNRCWSLVSYVQRTKTFLTATFRVWFSRVEKTPTVIAAGQDGTHLADTVITFNVWKKTD